MRLLLRNIGPIRNAEIQIGDKTVIYGKNGYGLSFIASALLFLTHIDTSDLVERLFENAFGMANVVSYGAEYGYMTLEGAVEVWVTKKKPIVQVYNVSLLHEFRPIAYFPTVTLFNSSYYHIDVPWLYTKYVKLEKSSDIQSVGLSVIQVIESLLESNARTVIIELPELGLDDDMQAYIAEKFREAKKKLIVLTHSRIIQAFMS